VKTGAFLCPDESPRKAGGCHISTSRPLGSHQVGTRPDAFMPFEMAPPEVESGGARIGRTPS
jgi:hypothetical protein